MALRLSHMGKELLTDWEGFELRVYLDVAGLETIGVGHLITAEEKTAGEIVINTLPVSYQDGLDREQVVDLLGQDVSRFETAVGRAVAYPLEQHQFDALVSFSFNVGIAAFRSSTLVRLLNQDQPETVPAQLRRWVRAGGKVSAGLVNRRENEIRLWSGGFH